MSKEVETVVIHIPGNTDALKLEARPVLIPRLGQVLIRIRAFGLNRSEFFTRSRNSRNQSSFPRILDNEGTGTIKDAPDGELKRADIVTTSMGGTDITFDSSYAEYTCVPATQLQISKTKLDWEVLRAISEML